MKESKVYLRTYVGGDVGHGKPSVPVHVEPSSNGLNLVLGAHDKRRREYFEKPNLYIERRPKGWAIVITHGGGDPVGLLYILDDGRCVLLKESTETPDSMIEVREASEGPPAGLA